MKLLRYYRFDDRESPVVLGIGLPGEFIADLGAGYARYLVEAAGEAKNIEAAAARVPDSLLPLVALGSPEQKALGGLHEWLAELAAREPDAKTPDGQPFFLPMAECRAHVPLRPSKLIAVGRNYKAHLAEFNVKLDHRIPSA